MEEDKKTTNLDEESPKEDKTKTDPDENLNDDLDELDDLDDNIDDDIDDDSNDTGESPKEDKDSVPLATFLEQKKKFKALEKKIAEMEDAKFEESIKTKKNQIKKKWLDKEFDEATAEAIAEEMAAVYEEFGNVRKSKQELILDTEIEELSSDSFYSDIKEYKEQIKNKIRSFKKAGVDLDVKDAYLMTVGVNTKLKESKIDAEVKASVKGTNQITSKNSNVATSTGSTKSKYNLSTQDLKNLKRLQKVQPDAKWDAKKYYEYVLKN